MTINYMLHLNSLNGCLCNRYRTSFSSKVSSYNH